MYLRRVREGVDRLAQAGGCTRLGISVFLLFICTSALADWQTRSSSQWTFDQSGAEMRFGVERVDIERLAPMADQQWLLRELAETVTVETRTGPCVLGDSTLLPSPPQTLVARLRFDCDTPLDSPRVSIRSFLRYTASPLHYAKFELPGASVDAALFTAAQPVVELTHAKPATSIGATLQRYLGLGFEHILIGLDHVAFLLCMLLVADTLRARILMITGFTLGHSLTLSLATLGLIEVESAAVEALIGYTVALVAVEVYMRAQSGRFAAVVLAAVVLGAGMLALQRGHTGLPLSTQLALVVVTPAYLALALRTRAPEKLHAGLTSMFGLIHGLGFATVLRALGLPPGQRGWALLGFNLGVEIGQLCLLAVFGTLLWSSARAIRREQASVLIRLTAIGLCGVGVFWFVDRSM